MDLLLVDLTALVVAQRHPGTPRLLATAIDSLIDERQWLREGRSLARLSTELQRLRGGVTHDNLPDGRKHISAEWTSGGALEPAQS